MASTDPVDPALQLKVHDLTHVAEKLDHIIGMWLFLYPLQIYVERD